MPTAAQIQNLVERIYTTATAGTPTNPAGLPPSLANLVVAQARHETDNFTSNPFKVNNNGYGYKYTGNAWQRGKGLKSPEGDYYADYLDIEDSTSEIVDWIYRRRKEGKFPQNLSDIKTPEQYATLLKKTGYYGDELAHYIAGLKRWLMNVVESVPVVNFAIFIVLAGSAWYFLNRKKKEAGDRLLAFVRASRFTAFRFCILSCNYSCG